MIEIIDSKTGLKYEIFSQDLKDSMDFNEAKHACKILGEGWRLPSLRELELMYDLYQKGVGNFSAYYYWSSVVDYDKIWYWDFREGFGYADYSAKYDLKNVRPIRSI
jgi:hypothetical protein